MKHYSLWVRTQKTPAIVRAGITKYLTYITIYVNFRVMKIICPAPFSLPDTAPELALRFCMILAGLAAVVARRFLRMPHLGRFTVLLCSRLSRAVPRLARALLRSGKVRAKRAPAARADRGVRVRAPAFRTALPSGRGWLVRELGWEAAAFTSQLEALLADPAMQAALVAAPGIGRIMRPICRMLGVAPAALPQAAAPLVDAAPEPAMRTVWTRPMAERTAENSVPMPGEIFSSA